MPRSFHATARSAPLRPAAPSKRRPVPLFIAAGVSSLWAALVSAAPMVMVTVLVWGADSRSTAPLTSAVKVGLNGWLLGHGVQLPMADGVKIGLAPLLWTALICWRLVLAGTGTARAIGAVRRGDVLRVAVAVAVCYGLLGTGVAIYARLGDTHAALWWAGPACGAVAFITAGYGASRVGDWDLKLWRGFPLWLRVGASCGAASMAAIGTVGALLMIASVLSEESRLRSIFTAGSPGVVGGIGLFVLCLLYAPTVLLWCCAYVVGSGFALGADTRVSPFEVEIGPIPTFPLLAGLPSGDLGGFAYAVLAVPVLIGLVSGVMVARRTADVSWLDAVGAALVAAIVTSALHGLLAFAAGGPLGAERLSTVGPSAWRVTLMTALVVGVSSLIGCVIWRLRPRRSAVKPADEVAPVSVVPAPRAEPEQQVTSEASPDPQRGPTPERAMSDPSEAPEPSAKPEVGGTVDVKEPAPAGDEKSAMPKPVE
ncbi:MAG: hypothetical protein HOQ05_01840 [Corynebacteriales bacterium]|nr:hypothetical protein [Mycobacteriales bacterium]